MVNLYDLLIFAFAIAVGAVAPGPNVLALVGSGLGSGYRPSLAAVLGAVMGFSVWMVLVVSNKPFIDVLLHSSVGEYWFWSFKLTSGVLLGYAAHRYWNAQEFEMPQTAPVGGGLSFLFQVTIMLSSFGTLAYFLALMGSYSSLFGQMSVTTSVLKVALTVVVTAIVMLLYAFLASRLRKFMSARLSGKRIYQTAAVLSGWAGISVLVR
jgi:threonine/homoserine/homoserine lactone efflux protein